MAESKWQSLSGSINTVNLTKLIQLSRHFDSQRALGTQFIDKRLRSFKCGLVELVVFEDFSKGSLYFRFSKHGHSLENAKELAEARTSVQELDARTRRVGTFDRQRVDGTRLETDR